MRFLFFFSFLFWCRFWISFGSWEAIFCVVYPWWSYKALLTAVGGKTDNVRSIAIKKYLKHASTEYFRMHKFPETCGQAPPMHSGKTACRRGVVSTYFFSSSLDITKRVKFLSSMKPIINAMAPPTAEAMMMVSVLSTTLTVNNSKRSASEVKALGN